MELLAGILVEPKAATAGAGRPRVCLTSCLTVKSPETRACCNGILQQAPSSGFSGRGYLEPQSCQMLSLNLLLGRNPSDALANARKDFPGNRPCSFRVVEGADRLIALRADDDDLVAGFDAGNLRHVHHRLVHADAAHERRAAP